MIERPHSQIWKLYTVDMSILQKQTSLFITAGKESKDLKVRRNYTFIFQIYCNDGIFKRLCDYGKQIIQCHKTGHRNKHTHPHDVLICDKDIT